LVADAASNVAGSAYDQQVWEECSRLITNCIIYYNATIWSYLFAPKERRGDAAGACTP
jgi:hypothetical protein